MKYKLILLFVFAVAISNVYSLGNVSGYVFDDLNKNGIKDKNESGIANVSVSNGLDVVQTNATGKYELAISDDAIIFVIKPSDYIYPVNQLNQPQFFYNHKPKGSPNLKYRGVEPTGNLPQSIDFPLYKTATTDTFKIAVFSDPQIFSEKHGKYYGIDIVDDLIKSSKVDFGITLGDMVNDQLDLLTFLNNETARINYPWFHVCGNHDINFDIEDYKYADETFERIYGPSTYAFNHGKVHFIVLNNIIYPNIHTNHSYIGGFRDEHLQFVSNSLKFVPKDNLIVLFMHIPLPNENQWGLTFVDESRNRLFEILAPYKFTFSLSGHTHTQKQHFFDKSNGWKNDSYHQHYTVGTASGDWWSGDFKTNSTPLSIMRDGTPNGYNILSFEGNKYYYDYKSASMPVNYKMRLYGPKLVKANIYNGGDLYVNFFQGSNRDSVEFNIDGGAWQSMRYTEEFDPHICANRVIWDTQNPMPNGDRPSAPEKSTHLWKTRIPTKLEIGEHTIYVRVKDIFGRVFTDEFKFNVINN